MNPFVKEAIADIDAGWEKVKEWAKTAEVAVSAFVKPLLTDIEHVLAHVAEADAVKLGQTAFEGLKAGKNHGDILAELSTATKALLPEDLEIGENALLGFSSAILSGAQVKLAADPTKNTND